MSLTEVHVMRLILAGVVLCLGAAIGQAQVRLDPALPEYERVQGVAGSIKSIGSDTLNNVMSQWAAEFQEHYPNVKIEIEGKGSKTAPPALIEGQAQFGPMSRPMKPSEIDAFESAFGYEPTRLRVGIDCLAVFVHKDNPIESLTLEQVERAFSVSEPRLTWGALGVDDPKFRDTPVSLYGRNSASGTYGYFKKHALGGNDFKAVVKEQSGSADVVQGVARDPHGLGYSGLGFVTSDVRAVPLARHAGDDASEPTFENALRGEYPLARFLNVYINYDHRRELDTLRAELIRLVFSRQGQEKLLEEGYFPVPAEVARQELERVGLLDARAEPGRAQAAGN